MNSIKKCGLLALFLVASIQKMHAMSVVSIAAAAATAGALPGVALYLNEWWKNGKALERVEKKLYKLADTVDNFKDTTDTNFTKVQTLISENHTASQTAHLKTQTTIDAFAQKFNDHKQDYVDFSSTTRETLDAIKSITTTSSTYLDQLRNEIFPKITGDINGLTTKTGTILDKLETVNELIAGLATKDELEKISKDIAENVAQKIFEMLNEKMDKQHQELKDVFVHVRKLNYAAVIGAWALNQSGKAARIAPSVGTLR